MNIDITLKPFSKTLYLVKTEGEPYGMIPGRTLVALGWHPGSWTIQENDIEPIETAIIHYAEKRLYDFLSQRERSEYECKTFLKQLFLSHRMIDRVIQPALERHYIDDCRFAELLVTSYGQRGKSKREILTKLHEFHVSSSIAENALNEFFPKEQQQENLRSLLEQLKKKYADLPTRKQTEKCVTALMRRGFTYSEIQSVLQIDWDD